MTSKVLYLEDCQIVVPVMMGNLLPWKWCHKLIAVIFGGEIILQVQIVDIGTNRLLSVKLSGGLFNQALLDPFG